MFAVALCGLFVLGACQPTPDRSADSETDHFAHIQDTFARSVLVRVIAQAGGLEKWQSIQSLDFQKFALLYDSTGKKEEEVLQIVQYQLPPNEEVVISWRENGASHQLTTQQGQAVKTVDGKPDTAASQQSLLQSIQQTTFVIGIPFKLLDKEVKVTYAGIDTLESGLVVQVLEVNYPSVQGADTWWHYFAQNDYSQAGYLVQHADHYSYVKNDRTTVVEGITFPVERSSYRLGENGEIEYLSAKYQYQDFRVTF